MVLQLSFLLPRSLTYSLHRHGKLLSTAVYQDWVLDSEP